jgi:hypothetical protein
VAADIKVIKSLHMIDLKMTALDEDQAMFLIDLAVSTKLP